jgi:hypothetical protein
VFPGANRSAGLDGRAAPAYIGGESVAPRAGWRIEPSIAEMAEKNTLKSITYGVEGIFCE